MKKIPAIAIHVASVAAVSLFLLLASSAQGQIPNQLNTGYPDNGVFHGSDIDNVQINNSGLHIEIPIYQAKGRGLNVGAKVVYNSKGWVFKTRCFTSGGGFCEDDVQGDPLGNTTFAFYGGFDYIFSASSRNCQAGFDLFYFRVGGYVLREPDGTKHHFTPRSFNRAILSTTAKSISQHCIC